MINLDICFSNDMNDSPLNEQIFDSKIWKKDSQDDKEESSIFTEKNDLSKNKPNKQQNKKSKKSKNSSSNSNSNNSDNNNSSSGNNNNIINKQKNNYNINNIFQKKLTLPISSIPYSLKMKKELNKNTKNKVIKKTIGTNKILQNFPPNNKGKDQNTNLLEKIKDKVNKERKVTTKNKIKEKIDLKNINKIIEKNNKSKSTNKEIKKEVNNTKISRLQTNIFEPKIKNNDNDNGNDNDIDNDNDLEEEEELNEQDNEILQINKVQSIDVKPNFINNNPYYSNSLGSNNNSNKSLTKQQCYTESDDSYNKSNLYDPPSGRSNNSNNTFLTANSYQGNRDINYPYSGLFKFENPLNIQNNNLNNTIFIPRKNTALMGSFLSTGANSYSHSGQRFDTSNSNESGQSSHNFNVLQRQFSNNNLNNNYIMQINPLEKYTHTNFNSNELVYKQPFSLNTSFYYKNNKNFSNNSEPKEKQIINLEDIARGKEKRTTVMIRNVPIKYTIKVLEKELEYFYGKYDCLYIPFDYENGGNKGYAFLNLINPYHVLLFYEFFQGKSWSFFESKKICELNFANFQGINEIKKHAKNYKGSKQPTFYSNVNYANNNKNIEVPKKYLYLILEKNPNLKYYENKQLNTIIINSFN